MGVSRWLPRQPVLVSLGLITLTSDTSIRYRPAEVLGGQRRRERRHVHGRYSENRDRPELQSRGCPNLDRDKRRQVGQYRASGIAQARRGIFDGNLVGGEPRQI